MTITAQQQTVLDLINKLNDSEFAGWFLPSEAMAFCQVESAFRPTAYRYEPRLGEGSYGLMQVLASTARSVDPTLTNPETMYDPEVGLRIGMKVAKLYWEQERAHFGRDPSKAEWAASYNEGVGGAERDVAAQRDPDPAYTSVWLATWSNWLAAGIDGDAPAAAPGTVDAVAPLIPPFVTATFALQGALHTAGFYSWAPDGDWGPLSRAALARYRQQHP